jgi:hypothetical protein
MPAQRALVAANKGDEGSKSLLRCFSKTKLLAQHLKATALKRPRFRFC